jgi:multicomponent Na+:H+ antiporter subunit E
MSRLTLGALLVLVWVLLWGGASPANLLGGVLVAVVLFVVYPNDLPTWPTRRVRPVALVGLAAHFVAGVVASNFWLTTAVLGPRRAVRTELVRVELCVDDPRLLTIVANLTALTPGAMVVRIDTDGPRPVVLLHVLTVRDPARFGGATVTLERRCVRAFGTDEQIALVEAAEVRP